MSFRQLQIYPNLANKVRSPLLGNVERMTLNDSTDSLSGEQNTIIHYFATWKRWHLVPPPLIPLMEKRENVSVKIILKQKQMKLTH